MEEFMSLKNLVIFQCNTDKLIGSSILNIYLQDIVMKLLEEVTC